jgi:FkbM family methyltransferase
MKPKSLKSSLRAIIRNLGYEINRVQSTELGADPYYDMRALTNNRERLICFDVGANVGQTIGYLRNSLRRPVIHSFEPGCEAFDELARRCSGIPDVHLNNFALGSHRTMLELNEHTHTDLSSFLELGTDGRGTVKQKITVEVRTVDDYCADRDIRQIDILKSDTQGFDLEVIKGAGNLIGQHRVQLIFLEITFSEMYKGLPRLDEIYRFLTDRGFALVTFYKFYYKNGQAGWTDAMFVDLKYRR